MRVKGGGGQPAKLGQKYSWRSALGSPLQEGGGTGRGGGRGTQAEEMCDAQPHHASRMSSLLATLSNRVGHKQPSFSPSACMKGCCSSAYNRQTLPRQLPLTPPPRARTHNCVVQLRPSLLQPGTPSEQHSFCHLVDDTDHPPSGLQHNCCCSCLSKALLQLSQGSCPPPPACLATKCT
jgi:hypothetical protein